MWNKTGRTPLIETNLFHMDVCRQSEFSSFQLCWPVDKPPFYSVTERCPLACELNSAIIRTGCLPVTLASFIFIPATEG